MKIGPKKNTTLGCVLVALIVLSACKLYLASQSSKYRYIEPEALPQFESQANFTDFFVFLNRFNIYRKEEFLKQAKF